MMNKGGILKNPVMFAFVIVTISCMFVLLISVLKLPDVRARDSKIVSLVPKKVKAVVSKTDKIGNFGEMIIDMLPKDLGFTIFLPSEKAFLRDLRLGWNGSLVGEKKDDNSNDDDDTYAILTRILGFSAVPRMIYSDDLMYEKEFSYDSLSGYILYIYKDSDGALVVNNRVRSEQVDLKKGEIVVHLMDGVVMDAEFEQSASSENSDENSAEGRLRAYRSLLGEIGAP